MLIYLYFWEVFNMQASKEEKEKIEEKVDRMMRILKEED